jgi:lipopolysaccharide export system permease protein
MRILDRYITGSVVVIFLSTIFIVCFFYILIDMTGKLDQLMDKSVPFSVFVEYYASFLPIILVETSSFACLIAVLIVYSRLNNHNEVIAMRAAGLNFWQMTRSALCLALLVSVFVFWINEYFVPDATLSSDKIRTENLAAESGARKKQEIHNLTFYGFNNRLFFIDAFDPNTLELSGITIIKQDEKQNFREKIVALKGTWTGIAWKFYQVQITTFNPTDLVNPTSVKIYPEKLMDIPETPQQLLEQKLKVTSMNIRQLSGYIKRFSTSGAFKAINSFKVDLHQKIALPFSNFVIILVGLPFALLGSRRKGLTFINIGVAIGIAFLSWVLTAVGLAFGKGGLLWPWVSAWIAPVFFFTAAMVMIRMKFS